MGANKGGWLVGTRGGRWLLAATGFAFTTRGAGARLLRFDSLGKAEQYCAKAAARRGWDLRPVKA